MAVALAVGGTGWLLYQDHRERVEIAAAKAAGAAEQNALRARLSAVGASVAQLQTDRAALGAEVRRLTGELTAARAASTGLSGRVGAVEAQQKTVAAQVQDQAQQISSGAVAAAAVDSLRVSQTALEHRVAATEVEAANWKHTDERVSLLAQKQDELANRHDSTALKLWRTAVTVGVPIGILTGVGR